MKFWEGNVFTGVCQLFWPRGVSAFPQCLGKEDPQVRKAPTDKAEPTSDAHLNTDTMGYGQQADSSTTTSY